MYSYKTVTEVTDNGPYITKLILEAPEELEAPMLDTETFSVYVEKLNPYTNEVFLTARVWLGPKVYPSRGYRPVTACYPCDETGKKVYASRLIALEMPYGPLYPLGYAQAAFKNSLNEFVHCAYRVTQVKEIPTEIPTAGWVFDESDGDICPQLKGWKNDISHYAALPLGYGYFTPDMEYAEKNLHRLDSNFGDEWEHELPEKLPLVVWLHGLGEGGTDPTVTYTGNKVVNLASDDIQRKLGGAAYVLCPQCPTYWMDDGSGRNNVESHRNPKSLYTEALKACIDEFISLHEDIDVDRVYVGGCSNGGFMTMNMIVNYPDFFAAAYPVCEAYQNSNVTEQDIQNLKHLPIWFTQSEDDPLVPPDSSPIPVLNRLRAAGNTNVHMSLFEHVIDQSGQFKNEKGEPWMYSGHFSWVHTYNDFCKYDIDGSLVFEDGRPVTLWRWMGKQSRKKK